MTLTESVVEGVSDNFRALVVVVGGFVAGVESGVIEGGYPSIPSLPGWWQLGALVVASVTVVGWIVGSKLADLLPDPPGHMIVALDATTDENLGVWELNDEAWEQLEVKEGTLYPWTDSPLDTYEARIYNETTNVAVANWREAAPASAFLGETDESEVRTLISELRDQYETDGRYARAIRRRFPSILRRLDARRAQDQNAALEGHLSPSFGEETIDDVIHDEVPPEALPSYMTGDQEGGDDDGDQEGGEFVGLDLLDGDEALEPAGPLANDGGEIQP